MPSQLESVGVVDLLNADPRPTLVLELPPLQSGSQCANNVIYRNPALIHDVMLWGAIQPTFSGTTHPELPAESAAFWAWALGFDNVQPTARGEAEHRPEPLSVTETCSSRPYLGVVWTKYTLHTKWIVLNANEAPASAEPLRKVRRDSSDIYEPTLGRIHGPEYAPILDVEAASSLPVATVPAESAGSMPALSGVLSDFLPDREPFLDVVESVDWHAHGLGPIDFWPPRLQQAFHQLIPDSRAVAMYWGSLGIAIYNESFSKFCGSQHPALLGRPVADVWPHMRQRLNQVMHLAPGKGSTLEGESRFFIEQPDGTIVETFVKWSLSPIMDHRTCVGVQHCLMETTTMRLWERRMNMLIELGDTLVTSRDVKAYWTRTIEELERWSLNYDVPLAFIYSICEDGDVETKNSKYQCPRTCRLEGSLGVPDGHPIAPELLELRRTDSGLAPRFREVLRTSNPLLLQTKDGTLPDKLLRGLQWRGYGEPCKAAVVCPIRPTKDESVMGILFMGLNPRRPYDYDYRQFISLLNQKLASSLASTVLLEEEARRGRNAAAQAAFDTAMLQQKLAYQTEQANRSIKNFQAVAEFIPVGMSFGDDKGNVTFANDAWYRITGYPKGPIAPGALLASALAEDRPKILLAQEQSQKQDVVTFEFRVPRGDGDPGPRTHVAGVMNQSEIWPSVERHVLAVSKAERASDGQVIRLLTCLTDVTLQKHTTEEAIRRAQEAENLKRLAEFATVGMFDMSMDGRLLSANNLFWELSGLPKVDLDKTAVEPWATCVEQEDMPVLKSSLEKLKLTCRPQTAEIRFKTQWTAEDAGGNSIVAPRWVLATFMPVKSSDGAIRSFTGCLSDFSVQKWQLQQEQRRKEEAIESKRQQENFIDMTSHEMRNPLSAILHCTDAIIASLSRVREIADGLAPSMRNSRVSPGALGELPQTDKWATELDELLHESIENAETIVTCAQHQKRIVDDILTMSKLDSKLLAVTPCTVNPIEIVRDALKMFEVEARRVDIVLTSVVDASYTDLGCESLDLDPSRVKQVLINLLTNALKFTKTGKTRNVTVCVKASRTVPGPEMTAVNFIPRFRDLSDEYEQPALIGRTNPIYLIFEVKDTGQGLSKTEMGNLFNRFVQASSKTHVKYGGSGLGLFISRRLTELQHGAIGVSSQAGIGSTFAFFIEAYVPDNSAGEEEMVTEVPMLASGLRGLCTSTGDSRGNSAAPSKPNAAALVEPRSLNMDDTGKPVELDGILVVEDNLINQRITQRSLVEKGYTVDVANHGLEALEKLQRSVRPSCLKPAINGEGRDGNPLERRNAACQPMPINLVLMDIEMPVQDGLTCTRRIRELESLGHVFRASGGRIPIIAVTANARLEQITEAKEAGCDEVIVKPYRIPELMEKMQVTVQRLRAFVLDSPSQ